MSATRIKICGMTRREDVRLAGELGVDALGLNFLKGPRQIGLAKARELLAVLDREVIPTMVAVGLCGVPCAEMPDCLTAGQVAAETEIRRFQVYGREQALLLNDDESMPYWMVVPVGNREHLAELSVFLSVENFHPQAIVLDTAVKGELGGTGQSFNWQWIAEAREAGELAGLPPLILAGGLHPDNVAEAIRIVLPYGVDVSSGVEVAGKPGVKDQVKMRDFVQAVRGAA